MTIMENADALFEACTEYFKWIEENPLTSEKVSFDKFGNEQRATIYHPHAMTIWGICIYLGIVSKTWYEWKKTRPELLDVMVWAEEIIKQQKFSAASVGLMNANIISRELGLKDHTTVDYVVPSMTVNPPSGEAPPPSPIHGE